MFPLRDVHAQEDGKTPYVTILLIAANALLFVYELSLGVNLEGFVMQAAFVPGRYTEGGITPA